MAGAPILELRGVGKRYGSRRALDALDLRVAAGEVVGLLGPNGAGKTTAVKLILGLVRPSEGSGSLFGRPLGDPGARQSTGYLPELFRNPPWLTAREVLGYHAELMGLPANGRTAETEAALANADLAARADDLVATYSKGMQQRLGVAVALLGRPAFVVLDEPATGLDPIGRQELRGMIRGLRELGTAILLNSHQLSEVEQVCDRVTILQAGRVLADGPLDELLEPGGVRIRVEGVTPSVLAAIEQFGPVRREDDELMVGRAGRADVPRIVAALVGAGARVHAVQPIQPSLEERFRDLLSSSPPPDGRA